MKSYIEDQFKAEIKSSKKLAVVSNFYETVKEMVENQEKGEGDEGTNEEEGINEDVEEEGLDVEVEGLDVESRMEFEEMPRR